MIVQYGIEISKFNEVNLLQQPFSAQPESSRKILAAGGGDGGGKGGDDGGGDGGAEQVNGCSNRLTTLNLEISIHITLHHHHHN